MIYLLTMFFIFVLCVVIHVSICRSAKVNILLVKNFLVTAGIGLGATWAIFLLLGKINSQPLNIWTLPLYFTSTFLFLLLTVIYLIFYVNTKLVSPSKKVLTLIRNSSGITEIEMSTHFSDEEFILTRLADLEKSGCVVKNSGRYQLLKSGKRIGIILEGYQKLLGREMGG